MRVGATAAYLCDVLASQERPFFFFLFLFLHLDIINYCPLRARFRQRRQTVRYDRHLTGSLVSGPVSGSVQLFSWTSECSQSELEIASPRIRLAVSHRRHAAHNPRGVSASRRSLSPYFTRIPPSVTRLACNRHRAHVFLPSMYNGWFALFLLTNLHLHVGKQQSTVRSTRKQPRRSHRRCRSTAVSTARLVPARAVFRRRWSARGG